jgi:putative acetyltransferase
MPPRFDVVELSEAHLPDLTDLWRASWQETMPEIDFEARIGWFQQHMKRLIGDGAVGRLALDRHGSEPLGFLMVHPKTGYLDQLAVSPDAKGKGVADALLAEARTLCPQGIELAVNTENPRALRFYERNGFTRTGGGTNPNSGRPTLSLSWRPDGEAETT